VVTTADGELRYSQLVLATGARPRRLALADESDAEVAYLRTLDDADRIRAAVTDGRHVVVIGGGWIGLEVASAAVAAGAHVTVLESLELPLVRVLGPEVAKRLTRIHREHGVDVRTGVQVSAVARGGVTLGDGSVLPADLVIVGVGVEPNVEIAAAAGLTIDNGILVDAALRTSEPDVFAVGDVADQEHPVLGRRVRVEHWDTALKQARAVAHSLMGEEVGFAELPYFFSDQYDVGLEYVGSPGPDGYDDVVIREGRGSSFVAWWLRDGVVVAGMHLDDWDAIDEIRATVGTRLQSSKL
jgi:NADPH-dependent 2,4-dienoyl-CoA reductase/sulfur reductase-like enzyme